MAELSYTNTNVHIQSCSSFFNFLQYLPLYIINLYYFFHHFQFSLYILYETHAWITVHFEPHSNYFLHLCRYSQIYMLKLFYEKGEIPHHKRYFPVCYMTLFRCSSFLLDFYIMFCSILPDCFSVQNPDHLQAPNIVSNISFDIVIPWLSATAFR